MGAQWPPQEVVEAVRRHLSTRFFEHRDLIEQVDLVGHDIQVVLREVGSDHRPHAVRYSLAKLPYGPGTGEVCESVDQWAIEIACDLDEAIGTREIESAERRTEPGGLVLPRWWKGKTWSR